MTIDWKSFFGDGRNEDSTYLKFDTFSIMLSPDLPEEFDGYTQYHSLLMYQYPDDEEDVFNEILAFVNVDDYKSGKCCKIVDFNAGDIYNAAEATPEIIQILQEFRAFLMEIGFECGGYIHEQIDDHMRCDKMNNAELLKTFVSLYVKISYFKNDRLISKQFDRCEKEICKRLGISQDELKDV